MESECFLDLSTENIKHPLVFFRRELLKFIFAEANESTFHFWKNIAVKLVPKVI